MPKVGAGTSFVRPSNGLFWLLVMASLMQRESQSTREPTPLQPALDQNWTQPDS